jgi:hypothetical protein
MEYGVWSLEQQLRFSGSPGGVCFAPLYNSKKRWKWSCLATVDKIRSDGMRCYRVLVLVFVIAANGGFKISMRSGQFARQQSATDAGMEDDVGPILVEQNFGERCQTI